MNDLNPVPSPTITEALQAELKAMTVDQLLAELVRGFQITAEYIRRMALIVDELDRKGYDLIKLNMGRRLHQLRLIACGNMLPEVLAQFGESRLLVDKVSSLPISEQKKLIEGERIKLVVYTSQGETTHRMYDALELKGDQIRQAFDKNNVRTETEQLQWLDRKRTAQTIKAPTTDRVGKLRADMELRGCYHKGEFVPLADLVAMVKLLQS